MNNQIYFNNHNTLDISKNNSKNTSLFTEGESVKYVVTKRLSPEQAIITVKGQKLLADISTDKPDRGIAKIISSFGKLELRIENSNAKAINTPYVNIANNEIVQILIGNSIKATAENVDYMQKVLKYFPNINKHHIGLIFSFMAKNLYPTMNQLTMFFSDMLLKDLKQQMSKYIEEQKTLSFNDKHNNVDNLLNSVYTKLFKNNDTIDKTLYNALQNNGYYAMFCILLDVFERQGDDGILKTIREMLLRLSANRKSKFLKNNIYSVPTFVNIDGEDRFVEILANDCRRDQQDEDNFVIGVICYDDYDKMLFEIYVKEVENHYKIEVNIFDKQLYLKYKKLSATLDNNVRELFLKNKKKVVFEVLFYEQPK